MPRSQPDAEDFLPLTPVAFEILLAVAEGERHGYDIMVGIERRTGGRLSPNPGTLYRALDRLARRGLLEIVERPPGGERDEPRKFFRLSKLGTRVAAAEAGRLADQLDTARARKLIEDPEGTS